MGWSRLIKREILIIPPIGVIGYHPAALPQNRGRHPLIWALVLGIENTGSTFFFMDEGADSGDIINQELIKIDPCDDAGTLYYKVLKVAKKQITKILHSLTIGNYERTPQNHSIANVWRKRTRVDGEIDWRMSAKNIHNLVRGLTKPYIGAHFILNGKEYKVWKSHIADDMRIKNAEPGKLVAIKSGIPYVKCGDCCIALLEVDPDFKFIEEGVYL
jgi:methionyl-tRNA formyltransferase